MESSNLFLLMLTLGAVAFYIGRSRSLLVAKPLGGIRHLHSLPNYYGLNALLWCALPSLIILVLWLIFDEPVINSVIMGSLPADIAPASLADYNLLLNKISNLADGIMSSKGQPASLIAVADSMAGLRVISQWSLTALCLILAVIGLYWGWYKIAAEFRARQSVEKVMENLLLGCACLAIFTTVGIVFSVLFESIQFFRSVPFFDFVFGLDWSPQTAIREDQVGSSGSFGAVPLFVGTLLISAVAMFVAVPIGLMSAIYLAEYSGKTVRTYAKPALEVLAGVPTVVYGFFAALTVAPFLRDLGADFGLTISSESALAAGLVMGVMIIPFISSLADDVITAVPQTMRDGSLAMGATHSETVRRVVIPAALPGIVAGVMLAISRAIGETMIVVMAAGLAAKLTANPLESVTTVTVQIVTLLTGDQEFDSPKTLAAFALGLMLFTVTLLLNIFALHIVKKYREQYE
ncbi:MAG: phosphate ABC transporter permease subunit PstC [Porticoccaceae bacterium]|mgnify:FL=1|jgi:phosphate transport system permease protein|nr:phosphate ABC transporter permease subunit PstC [Porticoccaceae bacterium]MDA8944274.1 phosphate ABC transporter permease subunit PstC [Porticoccaceae bacterium]